jgi:hypothetical protein
MGLDIWFKEDIKNILAGVEFANAHLVNYCREEEVQAYRDGFRAALLATAVSFGIYQFGPPAEAHRVGTRTALSTIIEQP